MLGSSIHSIQAEQPQPDRESSKRLDVAVWAHRALLPSHRVCASGNTAQKGSLLRSRVRAHDVSLRGVFVFFDGFPGAWDWDSLQAKYMERG